ncbi:hypothetical protein [Paenibacillus senegalimassiliensis]|uniref:hypothetical protein n=1 Tax=Paenibacillus senegalimassiliensis TaxID=1737426 RepID=UPI00073ED241|nr:hypothetical protein [Paenibacillus senegalimassiliensis]
MINIDYEYSKEIATLTKQEEIFDLLIKHFKEHNGIFAIEAQPGMGKTTLCNEINKYIESLNNKFTCIFLSSGRLDNVSKKYQPFLEFIMDNKNRKETIIQKFFIEGSKDVPYVGNILSSVFEIIFSKKNYQNDLSAQELAIIKSLNHLINNKKTFFVCDDLQNWDEDSIHLLIYLINENMENTNNQLSFLLLSECNSEQLNQIKNRIKIKVKDLILEPIKKNNIGYIMHIFRNDITISTKQANSLYNITGGNLKLLKELSSFTKYTTDISDLNTNSIFTLIKNRISNEIERESSVFIELLKKASISGPITQEQLLRKFFQKPEYEFRQILTHLCKMELLLNKDQKIEFVDSIVYKTFFNSFNSHEEIHYHHLLAQCIYILYPSEYKLRALHLNNAGNKQESLILSVIHLISYYREHGKETYLQDALNLSYQNDNKYYDFYRAIIQIYKLYFQGKYSEANIRVFNLETEILEFNFEIDYLKALINTNWHYSKSDFEEGQYYLEKWVNDKEFKSNNLEMWLRSTTLLLDFLYELNKINELHKYRGQIDKVFNEKSQTDLTIQRRKYMLKMKANVYLKIETAILETQKSYEYFSPTKNEVLDVQNYYISLLNHSANNLVLGNASYAYNLSSSAMKLVDSFSEIQFLKPEILINNYVLSGYLTNRINVTDCIDTIRMFLDNAENCADLILIQNNLVALYALSNDFEQAYEISESLYRDICNNTEIDSYYRYFVVNNFAMICYLKGETTKATNIFETIIDVIPLENDRIYFTVRSKHIHKLLCNKEITLSSDWNSTMVSKYPNEVGQAWDFWGKLFLFSELQTWSDC